MDKNRKKLLKSRLIVILLLIAAVVCVGVTDALVRESRNARSERLKYANEDYEKTIKEYADAHSIPYEKYPDEIIDMLGRNSETEDFVLSFPQEYGKAHTVDMSEYESCKTVPLFIQWDKRWGYMDYSGGVAGLTACGPLCLSMAAYYLTKSPDMSPDKIIEFAKENNYYAEGNGSRWTLISEGGEKLGLSVTELPLVKSKIINSLENGFPVICAMGKGHFTSTGHFIVLTGCENGKFSVNDPNSRERSRQLWNYDEIKDEIRNIWEIKV